MNILLVLVPISLVLLGFAIYAFVWAVRDGQYDDLDTPALEILVDEGRAEDRAQQCAVQRDAAHVEDSFLQCNESDNAFARARNDNAAEPRRDE